MVGGFGQNHIWSFQTPLSIGPCSVVDSALDCESGLEPRWRRHCGIQAVFFGKALLSSHVLSDGNVNRAVPCIRVYPLGTLKNHRNSKLDFLCILPLYMGRPNITIAVEWPLNLFQSINLFSI